MTKYDYILCFSGGLDSSILLKKLLCEQPTKVPLCLFFDYRQRNLTAELKASRTITKKWGVGLKVIKLPFYKFIADSALLTKQGKMVQGRAFWLEGRNILFGIISGILGAKLGVKMIYLGNHKQTAGFGIYKDTTTRCYYLLNSLIDSCFECNEIRIENPLEHFTKADIVTIGRRLKVDLKKTHSCAMGNKACGKCEICRKRKAALK